MRAFKYNIHYRFYFVFTCVYDGIELNHMLQNGDGMGGRKKICINDSALTMKCQINEQISLILFRVGQVTENLGV